MGIKRSHVSWTTRQEQDLRDLWVSDKSIKANMHLFGDHTYQAVIARAQKVLHLGHRPTLIRSTYSAVWDEVERLLKTGVMLTAREIAERLGFSVRHVTDVMNEKHNQEEPPIYIHLWRKAGSGHMYVPIWALGDEDDAKKPKRRTQNDINRIRRERRAIRNSVKVAGPFGIAMNQVLIREAA
jgi:hypothetical protein